MQSTIDLQDIHVENATQRTIANLGGKGSGKTTLLKMFLKDRGTTLVIDPLGVIKDKSIDAFRIVIRSTFDEKKLSEISQVTTALLKKKHNVVWSFNEMVQSESTYLIDILLPAVGYKDGFIFIDEIHEFCPVHGGSIEVERFIRHCRNRNIGVFITSQRPASVDKNVLALTDYLILFRMTWTHDVKAVRDLLKDIISKEELNEVMNRLPTLGFMEGYTLDYRRTELNHEDKQK